LQLCVTQETKMAFPNLRKAIDVFSSDCLIFVSVA
jgi:hypothetical protein